MNTTIRRAHRSEAALLTALATRSKAHWGYDAAFMAAAAPELVITDEVIDRAAACYLAERGGEVVGVYVLSVEDEKPTLRDLWVEPGAIGTGVGALLWRHMRDAARGLGFRVVRIESDPHAEAFYVRMGARRVGTSASKIMPGRFLPLLEVEP
jgi:GNAT superfamily N-acetyltransferase